MSALKTTQNNDRLPHSQHRLTASDEGQACFFLGGLWVTPPEPAVDDNEGDNGDFPDAA